MSQAQARAWWADVEHLREAAERRQAEDTRRRAAERRAAERRARVREAGETAEPREAGRSRARAATRVREASGGAVDELTARRAVALEERTPRPRRPVPIWLADDALADPVASARARAAAPRRTIEIRGQVALKPQTVAAPDAPRRETAPVRRHREHAGLAASFAARPDRMAFWAFALGLVLMLVAATSSHAAGLY